MPTDPSEFDGGEDLSRDPLARRVRRRAIVSQVRFAAARGSVQTLEGPVRHSSGAAIVTGAGGEQWPVERGRFETSYEAVSPTRMGEDGPYRHIASLAWARRFPQPFRVRLGGERGILHGEAGDWLVQYALGDLAIVAASVFEATYNEV
jgi:hypothetical protein